ncbi:MAG: hypothetical protein KKF54_06755, partial [Candidatus Omnitrophica bacterium]|nr:hypothetical protein [Candidatus Omnitrophota bacterium]
KVCKRLEKHLRSLGIYSSKWITPKMPSHLRKDKNIYREVNLTSLDKEGWQKLREKGYTAEELGYGN